MKKTIWFIVKILIAAIVAMFVAAWADEHHVGYHLGFVAVYFGGAIGVYYAIEGICAMWRKRQAEREDIIKFRRSIDYRQAAVFVGTACLYMGSPNECEELADYLQHYAQQAKARELTGEETQFDII